MVYGHFRKIIIVSIISSNYTIINYALTSTLLGVAQPTARGSVWNCGVKEEGVDKPAFLTAITETFVQK